MGVTMKKLTVSGHPGSGTSTLVEGLKNHFGWLSVNGGEIFRYEAKNRGMTLSEFGKLCSDDQSVDLELDEILRNYIADDETNIIESRLAGWWAFKMEAECRRIWLKVSEEPSISRYLVAQSTRGPVPALGAAPFVCGQIPALLGP